MPSIDEYSDKDGQMTGVRELQWPAARGIWHTWLLGEPGGDGRTHADLCVIGDSQTVTAVLSGKDEVLRFACRHKTFRTIALAATNKLPAICSSIVMDEVGGEEKLHLVLDNNNLHLKLLERQWTRLLIRRDSSEARLMAESLCGTHDLQRQLVIGSGKRLLRITSGSSELRLTIEREDNVPPARERGTWSHENRQARPISLHADGTRGWQMRVTLHREVNSFFIPSEGAQMLVDLLEAGGYPIREEMFGASKEVMAPWQKRIRQ